MPLVTAEGVSLFFVHVPKAGGTSVERYLEQRFGVLTAVDKNKHRGMRGTGLITPITHLAAIDLIELIPPNVDLCFAMVRDPVTRLQSEYRYQNGVSTSSRLSFSSWLHVMVACVAIEPRVFENHIRPQVDLVPADAEVFHLERGGMASMIARIDVVVGSSRPDLNQVHANSRHQGDITLHREDVELIEHVFAEDYARFGFTRIDRQALPRDRHRWARVATARVLAPAIVWRQRRRWVR